MKQKFEFFVFLFYMYIQYVYILYSICTVYTVYMYVYIGLYIIHQNTENIFIYLFLILDPWICEP